MKRVVILASSRSRAHWQVWWRRAIRSRRARCARGPSFRQRRNPGLREEGDRREADRSAGPGREHRQEPRRDRRRPPRQADGAGAGIGGRARLRQRGLPRHRRIGDARHRAGSGRQKRRPADLETVRLFNGPGNNSASIRDGVSHELKAGDVIVIPAGTGHWFTEDRRSHHLPDGAGSIPTRATPLRDEAMSKPTRPSRTNS